MIYQRHEFLHSIAHFIGHQMGPDIPMWVHPVLHVVLLWAGLFNADTLNGWAPVWGWNKLIPSAAVV